MFTGIVQATGILHAIERHAGDARMRVDASGLAMSDVRLGDSIAVNGVCLTVTAVNGDHFEADVSGETLAKTTLGSLKVGDRLNLEKALALGERLGGHLVTGHVDGVGKLVARHVQGRSVVMAFEAPPALARYIAAKGSICVDGVSLTVNAVERARFDVNLVPHTLEVTALGRLQLADTVNLEVDLVARYLERLMVGDAAAEPQGVTTELLMRLGFARDTRS